MDEDPAPLAMVEDYGRSIVDRRQHQNQNQNRNMPTIIMLHHQRTPHQCNVGPPGISFEERYTGLLDFQKAYGHDVHASNLVNPSLATDG
jgi:hypothetical protein